jgi:hypothetical protein
MKSKFFLYAALSGFLFVLSLGLYQQYKSTFIKSPVDVVLISNKDKPHSIHDQVTKYWPIHDQIHPNVDKVSDFFETWNNPLPILKTVTYKTHTDWLPNRYCWLCNYATHYKTSLHFIRRCLNTEKEFFTDNCNVGDVFNVFDPKSNVEFNLVVDLSRCKMLFLYTDHTSTTTDLLKVYDVSLGALDPKSKSQTLTPLGTYKLGCTVAIYEPGQFGYYKATSQEEELVTVFGKRWLPFGEEIRNCTKQAKGLGIHGLPYTRDGDLVKEEGTSIGKYNSLGCVRMRNDEIDDLYAIVITRPTFIEITDDYRKSSVYQQYLNGMDHV